MKNKTIYCLICLLLLSGCAHNDKHYIGHEYIGAKYISNPLGEAKIPDTDPLIRFDAFDCTTFVETALANGNLDELTKIRYKNGNIDFLNRNHFTELDWLENNNKRLENVSYLYGPLSTRHIVIDKQNWFKKNFGIATNIKKQPVNLEYISYKDLSKINIQTPLIVLFIHDGNGFYDKIGTDLAVVHMGFLLPNNILRHASKAHGRIVDTDFSKYVSAQKKNKHNIGIALVKIK